MHPRSFQERKEACQGYSPKKGSKDPTSRRRASILVQARDRIIMDHHGSTICPMKYDEFLWGLCDEFRITKNHRLDVSWCLLHMRVSWNHPFIDGFSLSSASIWGYPHGHGNLQWSSLCQHPGQSHLLRKKTVSEWPMAGFKTSGVWWFF